MPAPFLGCASSCGSFRQLEVPSFGVLITRILLFTLRTMFGSPILGKCHLVVANLSENPKAGSRTRNVLRTTMVHIALVAS